MLFKPSGTSQATVNGSRKIVLCGITWELFGNLASQVHSESAFWQDPQMSPMATNILESLFSDLGITLGRKEQQIQNLRMLNYNVP